MPSFLDKITLGSWPDWVAAIGTSLAFIVAAVSYARSVKVRREEQARLVYSKVIDVKHYKAGTELELLPNGAKRGALIGGGRTWTFAVPSSPDEKLRDVALAPVIQLTAVVHNGSKELIGPAKVQVVNIGRNNMGRKTTYDTFSVIVDVVDPESDYVVAFSWPNVDHAAGEPSLGTTLLFRDASGQWWRRHRAEPIEAVHDDPENAAGTPAERAGWAANVRAILGREPSPEPKVPLRARWHRFWRKRRGKSPIP